MSNEASAETLRDVVDRLQGEVAELRRSRKRLVEAADADRRAIERALHDGVQQFLVALAVDVHRIGGLVDGDPAAAKALLDEMAADVRAALVETAELARSVYPPMLDGRGLASALRAAADRARLTVAIDVPETPGFPPQITAAVYWSCVEALSSGSAGSHATISVRDADGGVAFEVAVAGHHAEIRLDRLRDPIEALGGSLTVDRENDAGLRLHGWLPLSG